MAKLAMTRISICGLKEDRRDVLDILQRLQIIETHSFVEEDDVFKKTKMPVSAGEFDRSIHDAEAALEVLNSLDGTKPDGMFSSLHGREPVEVSRYENFRDIYPKVSRSISRILELSKDVAEKKAEILKDSQQLEMLVPWEGLDVRLDLDGTESTAIFIGALPGEWTMEAVYEGLAMVMPVDVTIISTSKAQTCIMTVCTRESQNEVGAVLRGMGFVYPSVNTSLTPVEEQERLREEIKTLNEKIKASEEEILSFDGEKDNIKFLIDYQTIRSEKYNVINSIPQSSNTFILTGYTPVKYISRIEEALKDYDICIETCEPEEDEDTPVLLYNNPFSRCLEGVVSSYALPLKNEIDPTFIISLFYFVFFGFMLSDAGIGALLAIGAAVLLIKNKNMDWPLKRQIKLFMFGGIAAVFWGIMFGSYFGDMPAVVGREFLGKTVLVKPVWMDMQANPMAILAASLGLGLIHIFTGMGVAAYQQIRQKDWTGLIFDTGCWVVILIGLLMKLLSMDMIMNMLFSGADPFVSAQGGSIGLIAAGVGAIGVLIMGGRESKNPVKRLLKGAYAIYGITGYLSDVLSYSRLLALGLATGVISQVANMIGTMFGSGIVKVLVYIVVFLILNAINAGVNIMGAYVHTNRLQYVEFYSRFFEGGGRPFEPYSIKTKYYKFKEN